MSVAADRVNRIKRNPLYDLTDSSKVGLVASTRWKSSVVGDRDVVFIATTDDVDEHDEVVVPTGSVANSYFERVRSVMVDHHHETAYLVGKARMPLGKVRDPATGRQRGWKVTVSMLDNPLGNDLLRVVKEHGLGCSIGFEALNYRPASDDDKSMYGERVNGVIDRWNWIELSLTAMPANASCRSLSGGDAKSLCDLERMCTKGLISPETAYALGMPRETKRRRIILLG
jgi:hypothetical protein